MGIDSHMQWEKLIYSITYVSFTPDLLAACSYLRSCGTIRYIYVYIYIKLQWTQIGKSDVPFQLKHQANDKSKLILRCSGQINL